MASYTDILPEFKEYVPKYPLELIAQVGAQKQQKYEENVQKIQAQIDQVAGLDLAKDVHKAYLQSKLNELGNNMTMFAAGDFSNFQLVNSVAGMTKQLVRDSVIQNGVASTQKLRKEQARGEAFKKEGKSSVNREFDFMNEANSWLNDGKLETVYNGQYKQHIDVNKKVLDVIQKLHPNASVKDYPYVVNADGTVDYSRYASIMQKQGIKVLDEGQIKTAVNSVLDADDYDELASQGRYNYRGKSEAELQNAIFSTFSASEKEYRNKLDKLERERLATNNISQQLELDRSIGYYKSLLGDENTPGRLQEEYNSTIDLLSKSPDQVRANLYTRNWLDQVANGFSFREVSDEVLANPGRADFWKTKEFNLSQIKEAHDYQMARENLAISKANLRIAQSKEARELREEVRKVAKEQEDDDKTKPYFLGSGDVTTDNLESLKNYTNNLSNLTTENEGILTRLAASKSSLKTKVLPSDILVNIENYKNAKYVPTSDDEKRLFDRYIQNSTSIKTQQDLYTQKENEAFEKLGGKKEIEIINNGLRGRGNLNVTENGIKHSFSPKEVFDYLQKERWSSGESGDYLSINPESLSDREKIIYRSLTNRYNPLRKSVNPTTDSYLNNFSPILNTVRDLRTKVTSQLANDLAPITGTFKTEQAAVTFKDNNAKNRFVGELTNVAGANLNVKVAGENYTPKKVIESLKNKNVDDVEVQLVRKGDDYFVKIIDKKSPGDAQVMPVDANFVRLNPSLGKSYLNSSTDLSKIMLTNNGSTNIFKDYDHAHYHNGMFGGVINGKRTVTLPIAADLNMGDGGVYPEFKLKIPSVANPIILAWPHPTDIIDFENQYLPSLTDAKIISLFKTQYPNIEQLISQ